MAQRRLRDFLDPLQSFEHNVINLGVHTPGRFCGFDKINPVGALTFSIQHDGQGVGLKYMDDTNNQVGPIGVYMTPQGIMIVEDAPIGNYVVDTNFGNVNARLDLLVANHQFINLQGGQLSTYTIIKGPVASTTRPNLTNPNYQTVIGVLYILPNAIDLTGAVWTPERCPDSGDSADARLHELNTFTQQQQFSKGAPIVAPFNVDSGMGYWAFVTDGNTYEFLPSTLQVINGIRTHFSDPPPGTEINLLINEFCQISQLPISPAMSAYNHIKFSTGQANTIAVVSSQRTAVIQPPIGAIWVLKLLRMPGYYLAMSIEGHGYQREIKKGMIVTIELSNQEITDNFNTDGSGKNLYIGKQVCNGLNNTTDMRVRTWVMETNSPVFSGAPGVDPLASEILLTQGGYSMDDIGGENYHFLSIAEMPSHSHLVPIALTGGGGPAGGRSNTFGPNAPSDVTGGGASHNVRMPFRAALFVKQVI